MGGLSAFSLLPASLIRSSNPYLPVQITWHVHARDVLFFPPVLKRVGGDAVAKLTALHNSTDTVDHYDYGLADVDVTAIWLDKVNDLNPSRESIKSPA